MFKNLLLPLDLTEKNQVAVQTAADLATSKHGSITLLHVVETIPGLPEEEVRDFYAELEGKAEQVLAGWADELSKRGLTVHQVVLVGKRGREIVRYAEENQCDLILLTAKRVDREHPTAGFSSTSHLISVVAACPVLLIK